MLCSVYGGFSSYTSFSEVVVEYRRLLNVVVRGFKVKKLVEVPVPGGWSSSLAGCPGPAWRQNPSFLHFQQRVKRSPPQPSPLPSQPPYGRGRDKQTEYSNALLRRLKP